MNPPKRRRRAIPAPVRDEVLREAGYMCGNPGCRHILTLELHHIEWVRDGGTDAPGNLLALCPNCHSRHTQGIIPAEAIRHWKGVLQALNHAFNKEAMDLLLYLRTGAGKGVWYTGDGLLKFSGLIAAGLVRVVEAVSSPGKVMKGAALGAAISGRTGPLPHARTPATAVRVALSDRGRLLVEAWVAGDERCYRSALERGSA